MGYESKIVIVDRHESKASDWVFGSEIARFNLSKMGYEQVNGKTFHKVFTNPIDFDIYVNHSEEVEAEDFYKKDYYGKVCKWATVDALIEWLEQSEVGKDYRRAKLFLDFLRVLKSHEEDYRQICVVHYGY